MTAHGALPVKYYENEKVHSKRRFRKLEYGYGGRLDKRIGSHKY